MKLLQFLLVLLFANFCNTTTFDREHTGVYFHPYLSPEEFMDVHGEAYLLRLVNLISTKFSRVYLPRITKERYPTVERIPVVIANFNKNLSMSNSNGLLQKPIRVILAFGLEDKEEPIEFNTAVEIAKEANAIYPGTVESILFHITDVQSNDSAAFLSQQQRSSSYKLGICLYIGYVTHNFSSDFRDILKSSEQVIIYHTPTRQDFDIGAEEYVRVLTKRFSRCNKSIKEVNSKLNVLLWVEWPEIHTDGKRNVSGLVSFWKGMNEWAVGSDSEVILESAFDNPNDVPPRNSLGWWRFKSHHGGLDEFEFEEKEMAMQEMESEFGGCKEKHLLVVFTVLISSLITTALIGSGIFLLYRRLSMTGRENGIVEQAKFLKRSSGDSANDQSQLEHSYEDRTPIALQF